MERPGQSARSRRGPGPERQPPTPAPSVPHGADPPGGRDRGSTDVTSLCGVLSRRWMGWDPPPPRAAPAPGGPSHLPRGTQVHLLGNDSALCVLRNHLLPRLKRRGEAAWGPRTVRQSSLLEKKRVWQIHGLEMFF